MAYAGDGPEVFLIGNALFQALLNMTDGDALEQDNATRALVRKLHQARVRQSGVGRWEVTLTVRDMRTVAYLLSVNKADYPQLGTRFMNRLCSQSDVYRQIFHERQRAEAKERQE